MRNIEVISKISATEPFITLASSKTSVIALSGITGSASSIITGLYASQKGGVHVVIAANKDDAGYLYNDLTSFWSSENVLFFPSQYKRSILYGQPKESAEVQRTILLSRLNSGLESGDFLIVCTYPESIVEKCVGAPKIASSAIPIIKGKSYSIYEIENRLIEVGFSKVDFVYSPGQYSMRGGVVDIFSFSNNEPYRLDFFGDELEAIKEFDINTQLSKNEVDNIDIYPKFNNSEKVEPNLQFIDELFTELQIDNVTYYANSGVQVCQSIDNLYKKMEESQSPLLDSITPKEEFVNYLKKRRVITFRDQFSELTSNEEIKFNFVPQISFNKKFEMLRNFFLDKIDRGYQNYIVTQNQNQIERLESIFEKIEKGGQLFKNLPVSLHAGFVDECSKLVLLTDHQIFERHHRYEIASDLPKAESLTIKELNALKIGDFVVHIDHGIGKFGGLVQSSEGGKEYEAVKLVYDRGDFILVNVHSLSKISKYKDKETPITPKLHKLGGATWSKVKATTKSKIKDIVKDLIELYAKRKNSQGFAYSPDSYLQTELESSFMYEDTPDQQRATEAFKIDMERSMPMDRLVCGDVGFGKTEIAIRAAFKACCDGKQVAVLVPTTILSLQHYHTFSRRLKEFPVTVELISRARSAKDTRLITERLERGEIDILIGTHKLLGKSIKFKDLGLLIIDEEQKFGVSSKEKLRHLKENVDTLTLTATPIPRTLQFSLIGARDLSIINTPPPNRQSVTTEVHQFNEDLIKDAIEFEIKRGGQVYFVHNRVDDILLMANKIVSLVPNARVAVGHGQMPPANLEKIITNFIYGEYDVLISTTIVESGIDISNANTMIINNAQNFGLSDLHQLRGRVGRTNRKAYCYLFIPKDKILSELSHRRLNAIEDFSELGSGFNIAMQDLDIRGAGNLLGGEQSGFISDIGYETYQKILNEAVLEFREQYSDIIADDNKAMIDDREEYVTDCQFDVDYEAFIPDSYISNLNEKLLVYRNIDGFSSEKELEQYKLSLIDRFGKLPIQTERLLGIVNIRRMAKFLGFEKVIVKNGYFIANLPANSASSYYKTIRFKLLVEYITVNSSKTAKLKQGAKSLLISVAGVKEIVDAEDFVRGVYDYVKAGVSIDRQLP